MEKILFRKARLRFKTASHPTHVTFDDAKVTRLNVPWMHYNQARWDYAEPDVIKIEISGWAVVITGHNLGPLFEAIEDHTLSVLSAHPELANNPDSVDDTFATEIRFSKAPSLENALKSRKAPQLDLGLVIDQPVDA